ncbi:MAG: hypothetical protein ACYDFU_04210 [Nitrospirota bacterium]
MHLKKALFSAAAIVFLTAGVAGAAVFGPGFPNNSSIFQNHSGTISSLSGSVKKMTVTFLSASTGLTRFVNSIGTDTGDLFQANSGDFWQFADTVVFSASNNVDFPTGELRINSYLVPSLNGRVASGSGGFLYTSPPGNPGTGTQLRIGGGVIVRIVTNKSGARAAVRTLNFQPAEMTLQTFVNNTAIGAPVHGDARIVLPTMIKALTGHSIL